MNMAADTITIFIDAKHSNNRYCSGLWAWHSRIGWTYVMFKFQFLKYEIICFGIQLRDWRTNKVLTSIKDQTR